MTGPELSEATPEWMEHAVCAIEHVPVDVFFPTNGSDIEVLADGAWHTLDKLVDAAGPLIPPGRAEREAEHQRIRMLNQRGTGPRPRDPSHRWAEPIDTGRRAIVRHALIGLVRRQRIERMPNAEDLVAYRLTRTTR